MALLPWGMPRGMPAPPYMRDVLPIGPCCAHRAEVRPSGRSVPRRAELCPAGPRCAHRAKFCPVGPSCASSGRAVLRCWRPAGRAMLEAAGPSELRLLVAVGAVVFEPRHELGLVFELHSEPVVAAARAHWQKL